MNGCGKREKIAVRLSWVKGKRKSLSKLEWGLMGAGLGQERKKRKKRNLLISAFPGGVEGRKKREGLGCYFFPEKEEEKKRERYKKRKGRGTVDSGRRDTAGSHQNVMCESGREERRRNPDVLVSQRTEALPGEKERGIIVIAWWGGENS